MTGKRVLVARLDSMGDVLVCGPAVRAIAAQAEVVFLASSVGAPAARMLPGVADVMVWDSPWISEAAPPVSATGVKRLVRALRRGRFDEAVIFTSFHQSPLPLALLARLAGIARVSGASVDHPGSLLDVRVRPGETLDEDIPEPERALAIAEAAGYRPAVEDDGGLAVTGVRPPPRGLDEPYVVVHPGASAPARTWPAERFADVVRGLAAAGLRVAVTGSANERGLTASVASSAGVDLGGRLDLAQLAGVIGAARALVAGNTGPAHLAAAVRTPVVSLFSPVVPAVRWAPYGVPVALLGDQSAPCAGTRATHCPIPSHPCLSGVSAGRVVDACLRLANWPGRAIGASQMTARATTSPETGGGMSA